MSTQPADRKLTKKQRKILAFRERKGGGGKKPEGGHEGETDDAGDLPILEVQDEIDLGLELAQEDTAKTRAKTQVTGPADEAKVAKKKRKRDVEGEINEDGEAGTPPAKTKKPKKSKEDAGETADGGKADKPSKADSKSKQRYILFVGNLSYRTTTESILSHFSPCPSPPTVRLLTSRSKGPTGATTEKTKGCAFLEFSEGKSLQAALKLHHSELEGRRINVELTAGGGGKGEKRKDKLRKRNHTLEEERKRRALNPKSTTPLPISTLLERHSTTSGAVEVPSNPRTWTAEPGEKKNRGGKGKKKRKVESGGKSWASGPNAVTIG
ncbi:hypothetical protein BOTBODRAFT_172204 [Botryobasidium botryosum FD-172 SS1]|uniref:RRM domain-containing protein n=1 Tax=Botryobasidium botryosum (strain FD-172 SS1) TaxID=930990 RepID=A0A067MPW8_BOTB1|nr:hypothetical protein BOTBODRAFT_172204 [Botryobasidium botryosum FD-172 SS1]